jgi:hypothetical protein
MNASLLYEGKHLAELSFFLSSSKRDRGFWAAVKLEEKSISRIFCIPSSLVALFDETQW